MSELELELEQYKQVIERIQTNFCVRNIKRANSNNAKKLNKQAQTFVVRFVSTRLQL